MHIVLVDNHDSYTFNIDAMLRSAGADVTVLHNDDPALLTIGDVDGIVLSPGPGSPYVASDVGYGPALLARMPTVPVLGVCLGHQMLAILHGGSVEPVEPAHGRVCAVSHDNTGLFKGLPQRFPATRYHSLAVQSSPRADFRVTARSDDGTVMALTVTGLPRWGVQFHPESVETRTGPALIERFLEAVEPRVLRRRLPGPFDAEAVFVALYAEQTNTFWLDGSTTYLGKGAPSAPRTLPRTIAASQPLPGGYVGCLSYEGQSRWLYVDRVLAITDGDIELRALEGPGAREWIESTATALSTLRKVTHHRVMRQVEAAPARPARSKADYLADIAACKDYLARGESYEICLTNRLFLEPVSCPLELHREMRLRTPSRRSAYIAFDDFTICSATPETFLRVEPVGAITARPIKGTAPRHPDTAEDARIAAQLATSAKTRAENLMIVDLLRNDLNRVCDPGSVDVPGYMEVESYAAVHQLVSTVTGQLRAGVTALDAVHAAFPPGSMTGAPKERTVAILAELEAQPRGVYSGVLGVLGADGSADLSVVIRTMVCTSQEVSIGIGGAIVWDSDPEDEYAESMLKAKALLEAYAAVRASTPDRIQIQQSPDPPPVRKAIHGQRDEDRRAAGGHRAQAAARVPSERAQGRRDPPWSGHDPGGGRPG